MTVIRKGQIILIDTQIRTRETEHPLSRMQAALSDLWADVIERPKIRGAEKIARDLLRLHCPEQMAAFDKNLDDWDRAAKKDNLDGPDGLVAICERIGKQYVVLRKAIFGEGS